MRQHARVPVSGEVASSRGGVRPVGSRLYAFVETAAFIGVLNLMMIVMTLAGGVVLGVAPAYAAAVATTRGHLRGEGGSTVSRFVRYWRTGFVRANLLQAPGFFLMLVLATNYSVLGPGSALLGGALLVALVVVGSYQLLLVGMDSHYNLSIRDCVASATRFLTASPASPLLLVATVGVIGFFTWLLPGLLPVLSFGAVAYFSTALCLSFFDTNDKRVHA